MPPASRIRATVAWPVAIEDGVDHALVGRPRKEVAEVEPIADGLAQVVDRRGIVAQLIAARADGRHIGLGLATVRQLARAHGGSCGLRSRPGDGSVFWFELPRAATQGSNRR